MAVALSFSGWKDSECPFRFNALRIAKTYKEPESDAMLVGSAFANLMDRYRRRCFAIKLNSDMNFLDEAAAQSGIEGDNQTALLDLVDRFKSSEFAILPIGQAIWWETEWKAVFDDKLRYLQGPKAWFDKKAAFRAVVDFIYRAGNDLFIIDDKTGRASPDPFQLKIYAALMPRAIGMNPDRICCIFNNVIGKKEMVEYCMAELRDVDGLILERLKEVNSWTEFPAVACDQCKWCTVPGCPLRERAADTLILEVRDESKTPTLNIPTEITTKEEAERALQFVVFADDVVDQVKALLRGYVEGNGPVVAAGKVAELKPNEPWKATSVEKIVKTLAAYQIPVAQIWDSLSITEAAIEKLLKKNKAQDKLAMVLHYGERKSYKPRFGITNHQADRL